MNWQPFDTAPKDGSRILIVEESDSDEDIYLASWYQGKWSIDSVDRVIPLGEDTVVGNENFRVFTPTHWAHPLPHPYTERVKDTEY